MPKQIVKLKVKEVSLVDKPANMRKFILFKQEDGNMPDEELVLENVSSNMQDIIKAIVAAGEDKAELLKSLLSISDNEVDLLKSLISDDKEFMSEIEKAGISKEAHSAVKTALKALSKVKGELPDNFMEKLAKIGNFPFPEDKKDEIKKSFGIILKEDGTPDFDSVPEESRAMAEMLYKQNENIRKDNEDIRNESAELKKELNEERDERKLKDFINKAKEFKNLSVDALKLGPILKALNDNLSEDEFTEVNRILKAADESVAGLFKELGRNNTTDNSTGDKAIDKLEKAAKKIAEEDGITIEQAFTKALDANPVLAQQEREERVN